MRLLQQTLREQRDEMRDNGIALDVIGRIDDLPRSVRNTLDETEAFLSGGRDMTLVLALSYGGRAELTHAARTIAEDVRAGCLDPEEVDETLLASRLYTARYPDPDLVIRTSGEFRLSNFLLWQSAYAELVFLPVYWPEFGADHLRSAVSQFGARSRRYGGSEPEAAK
jgi:undecaprenyl diphosphate synthase